MKLILRISKLLIIFVPVIGLASPFIIFWMGIQKKELTCVLPSSSSEWARHSIPEGFDLIFKGELVPTLKIMSFSFTNTGNIPIRKADFEKSLRINFAEETRVLKATIVAASPSNLFPKLVIDQSSLSISPLLINPDDFFVLQVFLAGTTDPAPKIDARIEGIKAVKTQLVAPKRPTSTDKLLGLLLLAFVSGYAYAVSFLCDRTLLFRIVAVLLLFLISLFIGYLGGSGVLFGSHGLITPMIVSACLFFGSLVGLSRVVAWRRRPHFR